MLNDTMILNRVTDDQLMKSICKQLKIFSPTVTETRCINYSASQADTLQYGMDFAGRKRFIEKCKCELFELMRLSQRSQAAPSSFPLQQLYS